MLRPRWAICIFMFLSLTLAVTQDFPGLQNNESAEVAVLLGLEPLTERPRRQLSLSNAASKFLLKIYKEISNEELELPPETYNRKKRSTSRTKDNFITPSDRKKIAKCNNIITFASRPANKPNANNDLRLNFNINHVSRDLVMLHSTLRLYQDPALGSYNSEESPVYNTTITIYQPIGEDMHVVTSINSTTNSKGWLQFNITLLLKNWLQFRTLQRMSYGNELLVGIVLHLQHTPLEISGNNIGLITAEGHPELLDLQPFIIGYFNGPELVEKIQKLRYRRKLLKRKRRADLFMMQQQPKATENLNLPKSCERLNFTLDFAELQLHHMVIAPKKFEAYFCGGECNFPLGSQMNASNHAIVQTLMHLKQPHLPKPCCVPIKLGSISILRYVNQDSVNLIKFPQSVARECGCH